MDISELDALPRFFQFFISIFTSISGINTKIVIFASLNSDHDPMKKIFQEMDSATVKINNFIKQIKIFIGCLVLLLLYF